MNRAAVISVAALALLALAACSDVSTPLVPREAIVPVSAVTKRFPDVTMEAGTGPNETRVGQPLASRSAVFTSADGKKKVTLSIDQYASVDDAASAYQRAVE